MYDHNQPVVQKSFRQALPMVLFASSIFLLNYLDRSALGPLLPFLETEFGMDHAQAAGLMFFLSIGYSISILVSSYTAPLLRPRIMVALSISGCGLAMFGMALVNSPMTFGLMLFFLGFAAGQYFASGMATLRSLVLPADWGKAVSIHELGPNLSFVIAPLMATWGASLFGWRKVMTALGLASLAIAALFFLFGRGGEKKPARVSLAGMAKYCFSPKLWLIVALFSASISGQFAPYTVLTMHLVDDRGFSPEFAATILSLSRVPCPLVVLSAGWIMGRVGVRQSLYTFFFLYSLGMFLMALPWDAAMYVGLFLQPLATALVIPPIFALIMELYAEKELPLIISFSLPPASIVGIGIMPYIIGLMARHFASFNLGFALMGVLVFLTLPVLYLSRNLAKHRAV